MSGGAFGIRDFRWLWIGESISALGDQFALVALPWLALGVGGSALALGSVLALMAIPRALLMLIGGVFVDRLSPRRVMLASNAVRLLAVTALALLVLSGGARLWSLYAFALVFGVADAFFFPAQNAIVPALVDESRLQQANGIVQGTGQLAVFVGPALAGLVVAGLDTAGAGHDSRGMAIALLFDAATFLVSLGTLALIRGGGDGTGDERTIPEAIREGLAFVWRSPTIRFAVLVVMAINALIVGPFDVGVPVLAYARLPQGAAAFGTLMSALGGGSLAGMLAAAALPKVRPAAFGRVVMGVLSLAGLGLAGLSQVHSLAPAIAVTAVIGLATGYGNLMLITWAQQRIPAVMMGRVISLVGLVTMGLVPVSQVVAGAAVRFGLSAMLLVAGGAMAAVAAASLLAPRVRDMGREPTIGAVAAERPSVEAS